MTNEEIDAHLEEYKAANCKQVLASTVVAKRQSAYDVLSRMVGKAKVEEALNGQPANEA